MERADRSLRSFARRHVPGLLLVVAVLACMVWLAVALAPLPTWLRDQRLWAALLGSLLLFLLILWRIPKWQVSWARENLNADNLIDLENKCRATLAQMLGGGVALLGVGIGAFATWAEIDAARERRMTERLGAAFENLHSDQPAVRISGIRALARIARESEIHHWPIMEALTDTVRKTRRLSADPQAETGPVPDDIQAILTVLARRNRDFEKDPDLRLDLHSTDLTRAHLAGAHLERAYLLSVRFPFAILPGAHLSRAILKGAVLTRADLSAADLSAADLRHAKLSGAYLKDATLARANLGNANLSGANLKFADLTSADLSSADLTTADLASADLAFADLMNARLSGANLRGANLQRAENLTRVQLEAAITDDTILLPDYLKD